jgi:HD-like signal output (HDOD) protein
MSADYSDLAGDIRSKVEDITNLPAMPELATKLLHLKSKENASLDELINIIEVDPALAVQIIHYARSPLYGSQRHVESIANAIQTVGFERVINFVIGIHAGRAFKIPLAGPIGLRSLWKDAIYCATLMEMFARALPRKKDFSLGMVYLTGLLRNFGFLLLGHLFPDEFNMLNSLIEKNPQIPVMEQELKLLGTDHRELGVWLLRKWDISPEVIITTYEHHNQDLRGQYAVYPNLAFLAGCILKRDGIGDSENETTPEKLVENLGINDQVIDHVTQDFNQSRASLDSLIDSLI